MTDAREKARSLVDRYDVEFRGETFAKRSDERHAFIDAMAAALIQARAEALEEAAEYLERYTRDELLPAMRSKVISQRNAAQDAAKLMWVAANNIRALIQKDPT